MYFLSFIPEQQLEKQKVKTIRIKMKVAIVLACVLAMVAAAPKSGKLLFLSSGFR